MSEFKEYKPMEIEHNVKAAVENLRKAYWSNETKKVAKHYTEAEDIIISAICHQDYTVCKETTSGDAISREALKKKLQARHDNGEEDFDKGYNIGIEAAIELINNAESVETYTSTDLIEENKKGFNTARRLYERQQGEWINHRNDYGHNIADCSLCGKTMQWHDGDGDGIPRYCWYCGADMRGDKKETAFDDYLKEQLKDPEFRKEWEKLDGAE